MRVGDIGGLPKQAIPFGVAVHSGRKLLCHPRYHDRMTDHHFHAKKCNSQNGGYEETVKDSRLLPTTVEGRHLQVARGKSNDDHFSNSARSYRLPPNAQWESRDFMQSKISRNAILTQIGTYVARRIRLVGKMSVILLVLLLEAMKLTTYKYLVTKIATDDIGNAYIAENVLHLDSADSTLQ